MMTGVNTQLIALARQRIAKRAFVPSDAAAQGGPPPGGDPNAGGPPPDPGAGGGPPGPPPGPPPMDPGAGGPPPMDPSAMMPPPAPPDQGLGDIDAKVQGAVQKALQGAGLQGNTGNPKQPKPDINTIATDLFQLKKMFLAYLRRQGIELPQDILDGPNRDPMTGAPAVSPGGGSDVAPGSAQSPPQGNIPAIPPISPDALNAIGGDKQASALSPAGLLKEAGDVLRLYALVREREAARADLDGLLEEAAKMASAVPDTTVSYGQPYTLPATAVRTMNKAAAVAAMFRRRRRDQ